MDTLPASARLDPRFLPLLDEDTRAAARIIRDKAGATPTALIVLGSGLASALSQAWGQADESIPLSTLPGHLAPVADGHGHHLHIYQRTGRPILVADGRTHLYEGHGPQAVIALARASAAAGITRAILTNANGCLRDWELGDVMAITDHMNLSGTSPFKGPLFLDVSTLWDVELTTALRKVCQRAGTYALLRGPEYQTQAESRALAALGADCVGMSTIMEALALHALGVRVAGMSVVSDLSFAASATQASLVVDAARRASHTIVEGIEAALEC